MKTNVLLVAGMLFASVAFGQNKEENEVEVKAPVYKSEIDNSIYDFLSRSIEYPEELKTRGIEGTEVVQFTVTLEGNITDFKVINSVSPEVDNYIIETIKVTDGKWNPGTVYENPQTMETEVTLLFSQRSKVEMIKSAKTYQQKANVLLFEKNNWEKALKFYDRGITLLPNEESLLAARSYCKYLLGDNAGAQNDWDRLQILTDRNQNESEKYLANFDLKEYSEKMNSLSKNSGTK